MEKLYFAALSRVSSDEQIKGISPTDQIRRITAWVTSQPYDFELAQYEDEDGVMREAIFYEDYTGFEYERPEMDKIRDLAKRGIINAVIVIRVDRFARAQGVSILLEDYFAKLGVRLFSVEEGEFTPGTVNRYLAAIQRARAEDDAYTSKKRLREARRAYVKAGIPPSPGHCLYGYTKVGTKRETRYVIDEVQAEIVMQIYHLFLDERWTIMEIVHELNRNGIPSPAATKYLKPEKITGKWWDITVRNILRNPGYKGQLVVYKSETQENGSVRITDPDEYITINIPAIVTEDQWEQAVYRIEHSRDKWHQRPKTREYLLTGMITCACGHIIGPRSQTSTSGKRYHHYACASYKLGVLRKRCKFTPVSRVSADALEYTVWDFVERLVDEPEATIALYQEEQAKLETVLEDTQARIATIDELLEENKGQKHRLNRMYQKGQCDEEYFDAEWKRLNDEDKALMREREKTEAIINQHTASAGQLDELYAIGDDINQEEEIIFETKRRTLERLRTHITIEERDPDGQQWLTIEILGHSKRVCLKNGSAGGDFFHTPILPLLFRLPLLRG